MATDTIKPKVGKNCAIKRAQAFLELIQAGLPSQDLYDQAVTCLRAELQDGGLSLANLKITEEDLASFVPTY